MDRARVGLAAVAALAFSCGGQQAAPAPESVRPAASVTADAAPPPAAVTVPEGYVVMTVLAVGGVGNGSNAVVLVNEANARLVPLGIGGTEALSIALRHGGETFTRPLTHDLLDSLLDRVGAKLLKVQIDELRDGVFIGSVFVRHDGRTIEVDARPSDAIALALGRGAPIYVAQKVVAEAGIDADDLPREAPKTMQPPPDIPAPTP
jgi:bifunctional DNase/RNase